jgi:hypothetical protein
MQSLRERALLLGFLGCFVAGVAGCNDASDDTTDPAGASGAQPTGGASNTGGAANPGPTTGGGGAESGGGSSGAGGSPQGGDCTFTACGGDPGGTWTLVGYCRDGTWQTATGNLELASSGDYTFTLTDFPPEPEPPAPQTGSWAVDGTDLQVSANDPVPAFPGDGRFVRGQKGAFCATAGELRVRASNTHGHIWVFAPQP